MIRVDGGVLFDVDGTLLLDSVGHLLVLGETLSRHCGRTVPIHVDGQRPMLGGTDVSGWIDAEIARAALSDGSGEPASEAEVIAVMAQFERDYAAAAGRAGSGRVVDGGLAALERLHAAGIALGLVTGNSSFVARAKLTALGLDRFFRFDRDLGFGDWRPNRPAVAAAAARALAGKGGDVASLWYAGDTPRDIQAALAAGVRPIGVLTGMGTAEQLRAAGADSIVASVAELYPAP